MSLSSRPESGSPVSDNRRPCYRFANGFCTMGEGCKYAHRQMTPAEIEVRDKLRANKKRQADTTGAPREVCRFWKAGYCDYGDNCPNAHEGRRDGTTASGAASHGAGGRGGGSAPSTLSS